LITQKEAVARKIIELAINGDLPAIKYIFDRVDGFPTARVEREMDFPAKIELVTQYENDRVNADARDDSSED
jgi:hypothetical protein